jgi:hypothetical protein
MDNSVILFKYASRSRKDNFFRGLDSIVNNLYDKENYHIQSTFDSNDFSMNNDEVIGRLKTYEHFTYYFGNSKNKIDAINRDIDKFPNYDILINFSDDQIVHSLFFDRIIREAFNQIFPDTDGFIHFHDGNQNRLATMSVIGRKHFERTGVIYPNEYVSVYCDNHVQDYAQAVGKYYYMGDNIRIMKHLHPIHFDDVLFDDQYRRTEDRQVYMKDHSTYLHYKSINFGL